ncbi:MAG: hypothetical protein VX228_11760, partial [Pseudomonadota bacterium]|nr:hypothetical protein [Pseudomonadota bacterium]
KAANSWARQVHLEVFQILIAPSLGGKFKKKVCLLGEAEESWGKRGLLRPCICRPRFRGIGE